MLKIFILINAICFVLCGKVEKYTKTTASDKMTKNSASVKVSYPSNVKKQFKKLVFKPELPYGHGDRKRALYHPAWMDYCAPYHCDDYYREVCGLNRRKMKFRYFQSGCHLILNNMCSNFRGALKYDLVELKFCRVYIMFLRMTCPSDCREEEVDPVCAYSTKGGQVALFVNQCALDAANCRNNTQEYEPVKLTTCKTFLLRQNPE